MYLENWKQDGFTQMMKDFEEDPESWKNINVLLAIYSYGCYDGTAFVLFERDGKLYEVDGGHCSCYGLEQQWKPEETTVESLRHRLNNGQLGKGYYDNDRFDKELIEVLDKRFGK